MTNCKERSAEAASPTQQASPPWLGVVEAGDGSGVYLPTDAPPLAV